MKEKIFLVMILFFVCTIIFSPAVSAIQVTIDLEKLDSRTATQVLEAKKAQKATEKIETPTPEKMEQWADVGARIGKAIAATAKELSVEVNNFITTPVGKITVALIVWKVAGDDLWSIFGGTASWIVLTLLVGWSFRHFHMRERHVNKSDKTNPQITYIKRYEFKTNEARAISAIVHGLAFALVTFICMTIIF